jgi:hypothetical protein
LQNTFGESNYNSIRKIYLDIIEVKRSWLKWVIILKKHFMPE